jgi:hypothetical protein
LLTPRVVTRYAIRAEPMHKAAHVPAYTAWSLGMIVNDMISLVDLGTGNGVAGDALEDAPELRAAEAADEKLRELDNLLSISEVEAIGVDG